MGDACGCYFIQSDQEKPLWWDYIWAKDSRGRIFQAEETGNMEKGMLLSEFKNYKKKNDRRDVTGGKWATEEWWKTKTEEISKIAVRLTELILIIQ